ncbi:KAP family NTPase [Dyella sp. LX-66]|uniref:KAP family P-loop NTPase fold protein n=1 Tax=unclassified Dyella TaxID=2634549 RepID=UPI001BE0F475|nr:MULTISPECIES: P-loop NTPase fold protein [unclassified Dyella]MBT2117189.1 KAP family NTPase [Dyella sp. LX-1]MBT2139735.1 KAP family NTPase [Dyella sp. LX-66]
MTKDVPTISPDQPLTGDESIKQDKLQRMGLASASVAALQRVSTTTGFVLSIEGPWGSGKTSTLSMMEQLIRAGDSNRSIIVHFNPWLVGDRDSLVRQFLGAIASAIELTDHAGNAKKVAKEIQNYVRVFDFVKWVPGAEPWASIVKGVMESAGKAAGGVADQKERDIEGQKERLEKALRKFDRKIFVFIDDIDRLFPLEVFEMVRIVKAVGQLPNIGYIVAWDSEYIRRALKSAAVPRASTYIDKIVQVRLPLPAISTNSRLKLLNDAIVSLPEEALASHFPKQDERLQSLYFHGLRELLEQPRDITRVINTLAVIEPGLRGEIVLADILGLACLMVRAPRVYGELRRNPSLFTRTFKGVMPGDDDERKNHRERLERIYARTQNPDAVRELVHFLFPSTAKAGNKFALGGQVDVQGHIAAPSRLNIALSMAIGATDVSIVDAKRYILEPTRREVVEAKLSVENGLGFLEMLGEVADTLTTGEVGDLEGLCLAIARLVDKAPISPSDMQRQFFVIPVETLAVKAISRLVASCAPSQAKVIAYKVTTDADSLTVASEILTDGLQSAHEPGAIICDKSKQKMAGRKLAENSRAALKGSIFWGRANPARILWTIMRAAPSSAKSVFAEVKKGNPNLDEFALAFLRHGFSSNGGRSYALPDDPAVRNFVSVATLIKHAKKRLSDPDVGYPLRAAWRSVVDEKALYGKDGSDARM